MFGGIGDLGLTARNGALEQHSDSVFTGLQADETFVTDRFGESHQNGGSGILVTREPIIFYVFKSVIVIGPFAFRIFEMDGFGVIGKHKAAVGHSESLCI